MKKQERRDVIANDSIRVVTSNTFITAKGLDTLPLKCRKLLYLAIAQCRQTDEQFFLYQISIKNFAKIMDIEPSNVYAEARTITGKLFGVYIECVYENAWDQFSLFEKCSYRDGYILFQLDKQLSTFLLHLRGNFSKPLLNDFMRMRNKYSMSVWHLMQREMHSQKPTPMRQIDFELSLQELRQVTGTENRYPRISDFKSRVLDVAIKEIRDICLVDVQFKKRADGKVQYKKKGRKIIGFYFIARDIVRVPEFTPEEKERFKKNHQTRKQEREELKND